MSNSQYDVVIVGAGIAGPALAHALSNLRPKSQPPLRIALLERSLAEPNRIVGELLQPGGMNALRTLGLEDCVKGIDAVPVHGYAVVYNGNTVHIPYPNAAEGRSFHHGRFVMQLREKAKVARGVELIEATVSELIECEHTKRVIGVRATRKSSDPDAEPSPENFFADLTFVADGCFSKFRSQVLGSSLRTPQLKSHFVGFVLDRVTLPIPKHGTVVLVPGTGPVLLYQIGENDTRMLVDVQGGLPKDMAAYVREKIVPSLPKELHEAVLDVIAKGKPKSMPNSFLPASMQGTKHAKEGVILLGDSWNMRHPLTGGGMTVALSDVVTLTNLLAPLVTDPPAPDSPEALAQENPGPFSNWSHVAPLLADFHWSRKPISSTVNILSIALYDLFAAENDNLSVLREGCFKYFELGGECINGPVSLLSALAASPTLLAYHFFSVAFYSIWALFTHPQPKRIEGSEKVVMEIPSILDYPNLILRSIAAFWTACIVFLPPVWSEIRWW
ncbi:Squalene epoxidase [Tulasnella sp. 418]|nr:Squalene epoxidase [Tulasnella sp. 418]